jgi:3-hydroxyisobutyrate dehydrogenase-like beta-hydroxyacid dehydrogenase
MASLPLVGWIGAGRMGVPLASFILKAGYPLIVSTRNAVNRQKLTALGAREAANPSDCARTADVIFASLPDDSVLREVALGAEGVLANAKRDAIFVETSTVSPEVSAEVDREATRRRVAYLRAPISGNAVQAQSGDVSVLVSGPEAAWRTVQPIVATFSKAQTYFGTGEGARYMKLVANALVVNTAQAMAEALTLGRKAGLDWNTMLDTLAQSAMASPWLKAKAALLKKRDFTTTMTTRLTLKDIDLMLAAARANDVPMPLTALTRQLMQTLIGAGYGEEDYLSIIKLAEEQCGLPEVGWVERSDTHGRS